jgi:hypothetical protein
MLKLVMEEQLPPTLANDPNPEAMPAPSSLPASLPNDHSAPLAQPPTVPAAGGSVPSAPNKDQQPSMVTEKPQPKGTNSLAIIVLAVVFSVLIAVLAVYAYYKGRNIAG